MNPRYSTVKKYLEAYGVDLDVVLQAELDKMRAIH